MKKLKRQAQEELWGCWKLKSNADANRLREERVSEREKKEFSQWFMQYYIISADHDLHVFDGNFVLLLFSPASFC